MRWKVLLCGVTCFSGCLAAELSFSPATDDTEKIAMNVGGTYDFVFDEKNGELWTVNFSNDTIVAIDADEIMPPDKGAVLNAPKKHKTTVRALIPGVTMVTGTLTRSGESESAQVKTYEVTVQENGRAGQKTEKEKNEPITIEQGHEHVIGLTENPSTGYQWQFVVKGDVGAIDVTRGDWISGEDDEEEGEKRVDAPGSVAYTIKALKPGFVTLTFNLVRSWEKDVPPVDTASYDIVVPEVGKNE